jgi:hypothetical protein
VSKVRSVLKCGFGNGGRFDCSKTVVVPYSKRGRTDHDDATSASGSSLKNIVEWEIFLTVQNRLWNSKSARPQFKEMASEARRQRYVRT